MNQAAPIEPGLRAAQYVRASTEHQQYSTENQADKMLEYAEQRGMEIVCTYSDDGRSGLSIGGRASLQKLIDDVQAGGVDFNVILVYDVSRWGRFQDTDGGGVRGVIGDISTVSEAPKSSEKTV